MGHRSSGGGPSSRSFFYLVKTNPPTRDEFRSYFEKGLVPPDASGHQIELLKGVSMWATQEQARAGVLPETVRLCVGIEHVEDILVDLSQALAVAVQDAPKMAAE